MSLRFGTTAGATDIAGQRAVLLAGGIQKRTGDCPTGRGVGIGDLVFGSDAPVLVRFASLSSFSSR
jgi:hypothetical protein